WLDVGLHRVDLGDCRADRLLELLGNLVRGLERRVARQLQVEREFRAPLDVQNRDVVHLTYSGHGDRGCMRPLAQAGGLERLHVGARSTASSTASAAACPSPTPAVGDTPITTSANCLPPAWRIRRRRSSTTGRTPPIAARAAASASAGARSMRTSTLRRISRY